MKDYLLVIGIYFFTLLMSPLGIEFGWATERADLTLTPFSASHEDFHYSSYFLVKDDPRAALVDLLNFENIKKDFPYPVEPYNRLNHFGTWIKIPAGQLCQNTRAKVLERDSQSEVSFAPNGCVVKLGHWQDPYSDTLFESASAIQIDHLVPLKNAYMTGAHEWEPSKRCFYANYLHTSFHLISVSGIENIKKGDNSPAVYLPPNKKYICEYIKHWLQVKVIWKLRITPTEVDGIARTVEAEHCDHADFKMLTSQLESERKYIDEHADFCQRPEASNDLASGF